MPGSLTRREAAKIIEASYYYDGVADGSGVLKNKLGLRSNADLERAEIAAIVIRSKDLTHSIFSRTTASKPFTSICWVICTNGQDENGDTQLAEDPFPLQDQN